jgi:hypothetical protein
MPKLKRTYICPYCFNKHKLHQLKFRCERDNCRDRDKVHVEKWGGSETLPTVTEVPNSGLGILKTKMQTEIECRKCNNITTRRICHSCHSTLPTTIADYDDYIIAIIGAKESGKSHYIAVLMEEIYNSIGNAYNCYLKPEDDFTITRYNNEFYKPLFRENRTLNVTQSARANKKSNKPLLYTLSFSGKGLKSTKVITLAFFDTAGEDLLSENTMFDYTSYICNSSGIICLLDPLQLPIVQEQLHQNNIEIDMPNAHQETDTTDILVRTTNLIRQKLKLKVSKKIRIPIALSFSKIDAIQPLLDPSSKLNQASMHTETNAFDIIDFQGVDQEMKSLVQGWTRGNIPKLLEHNYKKFAYFGLSSLGHDPGTDKKIKKITPYRVADPFLWLLWKNKVIKGKVRK